MPNYTLPKKTKPDEVEGAPGLSTDSSGRSSPTARARSSLEGTNPGFRFLTVEQRMLPSSAYNDPVTEKVASMSMPHLTRPFQVSTSHSSQRPARRTSRDEFRQRIIETIDEALRILDDDDYDNDNKDESVVPQDK